MSGSLSHQSSYHSATRMELVIECFYGVQRNKNISKWRCQQLRMVASIRSQQKCRDHSATRIELVIECFCGVQRNKNVSKWRCQQLRKVASIQSRRKYRDHSATRMELVIECFCGVQRNKNVSKWRCCSPRFMIHLWRLTSLLLHHYSIIQLYEKQ